MTLAYIYYIRRYICLDHEQRILMATHIQALSLAYCIELSPVVLSDDLSERVFLVACLLDMLSSAAVRLCLECDIVCDRLRESYKVLIRESGNLVHIERTLSCHSRNRLVFRNIIRDHLDI